MAFDICGNDAEFNDIFIKNHGPANESTTQLIMRIYRGKLCITNVW
jgi:hypothetical protein